jgi:hypothetical protein
VCWTWAQPTDDDAEEGEDGVRGEHEDDGLEVSRTHERVPCLVMEGDWWSSSDVRGWVWVYQFELELGGDKHYTCR